MVTSSFVFSMRYFSLVEATIQTQLCIIVGFPSYRPNPFHPNIIWSKFSVYRNPLLDENVFSCIQPYTAIYGCIYRCILYIACLDHVSRFCSRSTLSHYFKNKKKFDPCTFSLLLFLFSLPHISRAWMIYIGSLIQETVDVTLAWDDDIQIEAHNPKPLIID